MKTSSQLLSTTLVMVISACGGAGGTQDGAGSPAPGNAAAGPICMSMAGGGVRVEASADCAGCGVGAAGAAIDGDFASYASMQVVRGGATRLRATAQPGIVYPAGNAAGIAAAEIFDISELTISTFLAGERQEATIAAPHLYTGAMQFFGFTTLLPFDAVEVEFRFLAPGTSNVTRDDSMQAVYEFCSDRPG
jgi:hypothetical protein